MRLFRRKHVWYAQVYDCDGRRIQRSTRCHDKRAAEKIARQWEQDASDPDYATADKATLTDALTLLIRDRDEQVKAGRRSADTVNFYRSKAGHLVRVLERDERDSPRPLRLVRLKASHVDHYIATRRLEGAAEGTIAKELVTLRAALKLARRAGLWRGAPEAIIPAGFSPEYVPRTRSLTRPELQRVLAFLPPDRAARVAFIVATSACWGESERVRREDVDVGTWTVHIRGTKRKSRLRTVPITTDTQRHLLIYALKYAEGTNGALFQAWPGHNKQLARVCRDLGIERCSPNDLRRTCAT